MARKNLPSLAGVGMVVVGFTSACTRDRVLDGLPPGEEEDCYEIGVFCNVLLEEWYIHSYVSLGHTK